MDTYIDTQEAADRLLKASDYLTEQAQCYTVIGDRRHLENYFHETEIDRRRDKAIELMQARLPESAALTALKGAMQESIALTVFIPISIFYLKEKITFDYVMAMLCILGAVFFIFRSKIMG